MYFTVPDITFLEKNIFLGFSTNNLEAKSQLSFFAGDLLVTVIYALLLYCELTLICVCACVCVCVCVCV